MVGTKNMVFFVVFLPYIYVTVANHEERSEFCGLNPVKRMLNTLGISNQGSCLLKNKRDIGYLVESYLEILDRRDVAIKPDFADRDGEFTVEKNFPDKFVGTLRNHFNKNGDPTSKKNFADQASMSSVDQTSGDDVERNKFAVQIGDVKIKINFADQTTDTLRNNFADSPTKQPQIVVVQRIKYCCSPYCDMFMKRMGNPKESLVICI